MEVVPPHTPCNRPGEVGFGNTAPWYRSNECGERRDGIRFAGFEEADKGDMEVGPSVNTHLFVALKAKGGDAPQAALDTSLLLLTERSIRA